MAGERTEQATPQRRDKARREGDIVHSRELNAAAGTLAGVMMIGVAVPQFLAAWMRSLEDLLALGGLGHWESATTAATMRALLGLAGTVLMPLAGVGMAVVVATAGMGMLQTGGVQFHPQALAWKLNRVSPLANLKNLFSLRAVARLAKSLIPASLLMVFAIQRMTRQWLLAPFSSARMLLLGEDVYGLLLAAAWIMFGWALVDYVVEWRSREQRLRMSRQEMREEFRDTEGNPQIRGRIRNLQRQARRRRMKTDVAKAAVVITNPTHYAVALEFDFETMEAPKVLAKGRNLLAEEIKQQARWAGVPILENPPLARSLYRSVEPGQSIPVDLYAAVASILAYLYRQRVEQQMRERAAAGNGARAEGNPSSQRSARPAASAPARIEGTLRPSTGRGQRRARSSRQATGDRPGAGGIAASGAGGTAGDGAPDETDAPAPEARGPGASGAGNPDPANEVRDDGGNDRTSGTARPSGEGEQT